jgi:hypothetical protein
VRAGLGKSEDRLDYRRSLIVSIWYGVVGILTSDEEDGGGCCLFGVSYYVGSEEGQSDSVCYDKGERPILSILAHPKDDFGLTCRNP